jgi:hypothetical protein
MGRAWQGRCRRSGVALLVLVTGVPALPGRSSEAGLEVVVTRAGRSVPGLALRLACPGVERRTLTDREGRARLLHLPPCAYGLEVGAAPARPVPLASAGGHLAQVRLDGVGGLLVTLEPAGPPRSGFAEPDRARLPRAGHPWALLRDVPGLVLDRVDVGGSDTAQQALTVGHGDSGPGTTFHLDGFDLTDPAAPGSLAFFPDLDDVGRAEVRTFGLDVRARTPGARVDLGYGWAEDGVHGRVHLRAASASLQADNLPEALRDRPFLRNRTREVADLGGQAGASFAGGRGWAWGAASLSRFRQRALAEHDERLSTSNVSTKARLLGLGGRTTLLALRSEKVHDERDTTLGASPEARWRQSGPAHLLGLEHVRAAGNASLLARLSWLDAGFRLEPPGGPRAEPFEDFRGVFHGSYLRFDTTRRRAQADFEVEGSTRALGIRHELLAGLSSRVATVATEAAWPGGKVLALERQGVFFRAFGLAGFAVPTRDQDGRARLHELAVFVQDRVQLGRLALTAGLRLDRISGRNLPAAVDANPVFPELLPAVSSPGSPARLRWLDLLPRTWLSWDVAGDGRTRLEAGYAAYAAALGSGEVAFDDPVGREPASLTFYWRDRDLDHVVDAGELDLLRGRLGFAGLDPERPGATFSPHLVEAGLRAPRTEEGAVRLFRSFSPGLRASLAASGRRTRDVLWTPLRNLTVADYAARGSVRGTLFGREYFLAVFAPASGARLAPGHGRILANRMGYRQEAVSLEASVSGRIAGRVDWSAWGALMDAREYFEDVDRSVQDPTATDTSPLRDGGRLAVRGRGLGREDVFVQARWMAGGWLAAGLPAGFEASFLVHARDGFPVPYVHLGTSGDPTAGAKAVLVTDALDSHRLPTLLTADARLARAFRLGRGRLRATADVFNAANASTTLQATRDVEAPALGRPREVLRPRLVRLGLEWSF